MVRLHDLRGRRGLRLLHPQQEAVLIRHAGAGVLLPGSTSPK